MLTACRTVPSSHGISRHGSRRKLTFSQLVLIFCPKKIEGLDVLPRTYGRYCHVPTTHKITLGEIVDLLKSFAEQPETLMVIEIPKNSFTKKLYSTHLSWLPERKVSFPRKMNVDARGSFTELVHTPNCGQVSINISKSGITVVGISITLPFDVKRVYYLYDIPGGEGRGALAHKELEQLIVAASGSFTVTLDDGQCKRSFFLNRPYQGRYVKPGLRRELEDFSSGAV